VHGEREAPTHRVSTIGVEPAELPQITYITPYPHREKSLSPLPGYHMHGEKRDQKYRFTAFEPGVLVFESSKNGIPIRGEKEEIGLPRARRSGCKTSSVSHAHKGKGRRPGKVERTECRG